MKGWRGGGGRSGPGSGPSVSRGLPRSAAVIAPFPAPALQTGHEVLPHPAFPRAVGRPHSALPTRWRTTQASTTSDEPHHSLWMGRWLRLSRSKPTALVEDSHTRLQALRYDGFCSSVGHHYYDLLRLPLGAQPLRRFAAYRLRRYRASWCSTSRPLNAGAETDLSCSTTDCATIPPSLPRRVHRRCDLQDLHAVHGLRPVKKGSAPAS